MASKFKVGDHVDHIAAGDGSFPAGSGTIDSVAGTPSGPFTYRVKCDKTGKVLPGSFQEADLTAK